MVAGEEDEEKEEYGIMVMMVGVVFSPPFGKGLSIQSSSMHRWVVVVVVVVVVVMVVGSSKERLVNGLD